MLADWTYAGQPVDAFWALSPREYHACIGGFVQRRRDDFNMAIRQAHTTAVLGRTEKIGPVDDYLIGEAGKARSDQVPAGEGLAAWAAVLEGLGR
ncbi:hypothetical protein ACFFUB_02390 [Algimonas porphyrae]|uniref:Uncharacterized protein n=1 Tax=Algimonas porphyrae TaxID=1128113 RepID=A0ABQ5UZP5_9PROT|nr:hypothetical protein [Algimonas porphyrae]GLQ20394.1 hypothetical protein GCM10007854_13490 [Algimonas porphyrae]